MASEGLKALLSRPVQDVFAELDVFKDGQLTTNELGRFCGAIGFPSSRAFIRTWDTSDADSSISLSEFSSAFNSEIALLQAQDPVWRMQVTLTIGTLIACCFFLVAACAPAWVAGRGLKGSLAVAAALATVATYSYLQDIFNTAMSLALQLPLTLSVFLVASGAWLWLRHTVLPWLCPARPSREPTQPPAATPATPLPPAKALQHPEVVHVEEEGEESDVDLTVPSPPSPQHPAPTPAPSTPPRALTEFEMLLAANDMTVQQVQATASASRSRRARSPARPADLSAGGTHMLHVPATPYVPHQGAMPGSAGVSTIRGGLGDTGRLSLPASIATTPGTRLSASWANTPGDSLRYAGTPQLNTPGLGLQETPVQADMRYSGVETYRRGTASRRRRRR